MGFQILLQRFFFGFAHCLTGIEVRLFNGLMPFFADSPVLLAGFHTVFEAGQHAVLFFDGAGQFEDEFTVIAQVGKGAGWVALLVVAQILLELSLLLVRLTVFGQGAGQVGAAQLFLIVTQITESGKALGVSHQSLAPPWMSCSNSAMLCSKPTETV